MKINKKFKLEKFVFLSLDFIYQSVREWNIYLSNVLFFNRVSQNKNIYENQKFKVLMKYNELQNVKYNIF